jgi:hypothetical protein
MKRAGRLVVLAIVMMTASCFAGPPSAVRTSVRPPAHSATHLAAPASCPVTRPMPHAAPGKNLMYALGVPFGWYGNTALRVEVPSQGVLPAMHPTGSAWANEWGTKFPWWRLVPGNLTIAAHRLDGPSRGFHGTVASGYGRLGFISAGLIWPAPGCWQVTGTVSGHSLTFVTWVKTINA